VPVHQPMLQPSSLPHSCARFAQKAETQSLTLYLYL
jgi:hypothetical protein